MGYYSKSRRFQLFLPIVLILMIFMRLVWMQLRTYPLDPSQRSLLNIALINQATSRCAIDSKFFEEFKLIDLFSDDLATKQKTYDWFRSPLYQQIVKLACSDGVFDPAFLMRINQWTFVSMVAISALALRMIASSWVIGLTGALILMSRGRLMSDLFAINANAPICFLLVVYFTTCVHFFRTGSLVTLTLGAFSVLLLGLFDHTMAFLAFAMPLLLITVYFLRKFLAVPALERLHHEKRRVKEIVRKSNLKSYQANPYSVLMFDFLQWILGKPPANEAAPTPKARKDQDYARGGLFAVIGIPFALWAFHRGRWLKIALFWTVMGMGICLAVVGWRFFGLEQSDFQVFTGFFRDVFSRDFATHWLYTWFIGLIAIVDIHYGLSLLAILLCAFQSPKIGMISFFECAWLFIFALLLVTVAALGFDALEVPLLVALSQPASSLDLKLSLWPRNQDLLIWFEPLVLTLAVAAVFNLFKVAENYLVKRKP